MPKNFNHHNSNVGKDDGGTNMVETNAIVFETIQANSTIGFLLSVPNLWLVWWSRVRKMRFYASLF
ncbi:hypothetical protein TIFTF001_014481 [Ficus carica]|uniref:Transmembrane protein n=1 Tax=Ficus carica TaxID=3494 RepID=A0AA88DIG4_FICCA|nr:hypothetical protein TIFTF001_014481 [Ficus carica]